MTNHSDANQSFPAKFPQANWQWLQGRVQQVEAANLFGGWIQEQLITLEEDFSEWITPKSLLRSQRQKVNRGRDSNAEAAE